MSELEIEFENHATMQEGIWVTSYSPYENLFITIDEMLCAFQIDAEPNFNNSNTNLTIVTKDGFLGFTDKEEVGLDKLEQTLGRQKYFKAMAACPYQRSNGEPQSIIIMKDSFHLLWRNEEHGLSMILSDTKKFRTTYLRQVTQLDREFAAYIEDNFFQDPNEPETFMSKQYYPEMVGQGLKTTSP